MGISRQTNLNIGIPSVADLGGQRVLNMSGSLTNWINTGNAGTLDTFQSGNRVATVNNKRKNKNIGNVIKIALGTVAAVATGIVAVKLGKKYNLLDSAKVTEFKGKISDFFGNIKTIPKDVTKRAKANVAEKLEPLFEQGAFETIKLDRVDDGKLELLLIADKADKKELKRLKGKISKLKKAGYDTDDIKQQINTLFKKKPIKVAKPPAYLRRFLKSNNYETIKLEYIDGKLQLSAIDGKIPDVDELDKLAGKISGLVKKGYNDKGLGDKISELYPNAKLKQVIESYNFKTLGFEYVDGKVQLSDLDRDVVMLSELDCLEGEISKIPHDSEIFKELTERVKSLQAETFLRDLSQKGLFDGAYKAEIDEDNKIIRLSTSAKFYNFVVCQDEVVKQLRRLKKFREETDYNVIVPNDLLVAPYIKECVSPKAPREFTPPDVSNFGKGSGKGEIPKDNGGDIDLMEPSGKVLSDIPLANTDSASNQKPQAPDDIDNIDRVFKIFGN